MNGTRTMLAAALAASAALGQTFVVDVNNGPGTNFTSLPAAVATAPSGSVLLVRAGTYDPFSLSGKGLTILGEPGASIAGYPPWTLGIANTTANQAVVLRGFQLMSPFNMQMYVVCQNCQGPLLLQHLTVVPSLVQELRLTQCAQAIVDDCGPFASGGFGTVAIHVAASNVVLNDVSANCLSGQALLADSSQVQILGGTLSGGIGPTAPLLLQNGASVRVAGNASILGTLFGPGPLAIGGTGTLVLDPATTLVGAIGASLVTTVRTLGTVQASGGAVGTTASAVLRGPVGGLGSLFAGVAGPPSVLPGVQYDVWLVPSSAVPGAFGLLTPPLSSSFAVPANPLLLGQLWCWQGVTFDPVFGLAATNPAWFTP